jgi:hypothetical protein
VTPSFPQPRTFTTCVINAVSLIDEQRDAIGAIDDLVDNLR